MDTLAPGSGSRAHTLEPEQRLALPYLICLLGQLIVCVRLARRCAPFPSSQNRSLEKSE